MKKIVILFLLVLLLHQAAFTLEVRKDSSGRELYATDRIKVKLSEVASEKIKQNLERDGEFSKTGLKELDSLVKSINVSKIVNGYKVHHGERPAIDLSKVTPDMYEPGKIMIKLAPEMADLIEDDKIINKTKDGFVRTGVKSIDEMNTKFKAEQYRPALYNLYDVSPASNKFRERHIAWGFNLWQEITLEEGIDVLEAVKKYQNLAEVQIAEPIYKKVRFSVEPKATPKWSPNDPGYSDQWHYHNTGQQAGTADCDIDLPEAWDIEKGSSDVIVAVIDGGVEHTHPDLNMWPGIGPDGASTVGDDHGSHVAGTIGAITNNNLGVAGVAGGSGSGDGAQIMSIDLFNPVAITTVLGMFTYAADNGAAISQNSWGYGGAGNYVQNEIDGIDYFIENGGGSVLNGGIVIFAAGNDNDDGAWWPGYYAEAMSVAATNNNDERSYYSNYGDWIHIAAPGGEQFVENDPKGVYSTTNFADGSYKWIQGTSMACPHVSGVAALLVSNAHRNSLMLTNTQVWDLLVNNVDDIDAENPSYIGLLGSGRLNANSALLALQGMFTSDPPGVPTLSSPSNGSSTIDLTPTFDWEDNDYTTSYTIQADNNSNFASPEINEVVSLSEYTPTVEMDYGTYSWRVRATNANGSSSYTTSWTLTISSPTPTDLLASVNGADVSLSWTAPAPPADTFADGFETYTDFALDFAPWTQIDNDGGETWGITDVTFPNSGYIGSYIIFNPAEATPALTTGWEPHIGSKYAAVFDAVTASAPNDDWLITPQLRLGSGYDLDFYAKSYTDQYGLERFKVGVSTTGTDVGDFTIINPGSYVEAPTAWTNYNYDLSSYADQDVYIAIICVSNDAFVFMVDDVTINNSKGEVVLAQGFEELSKKTDKFTLSKSVLKGVESPKAPLINHAKLAKAATLTGYKVYRDGSPITTIANPATVTYDDNDLSNGDYSYYVTATYSNPVSESVGSNVEDVTISENPPGYGEGDNLGDNTQPAFVDVEPIDIDESSVDPNVSIDPDPDTDITVHITVTDEIQGSTPVPNPNYVVISYAAEVIGTISGINLAFDLEFTGLTDLDHQVYWLNGTNWEAPGGGSDWSTANHVKFNLTLTDRNASTEIILFRDDPLPVALSSFTAIYSGASPLISWTTQSESDNVGWNVYRGISNNMGQSFIINNNTIPGSGNTSEPTNYSYTDEYPVQENHTYWYWLESICTDGEADFHGPISLSITIEGNEIPEIPLETVLYQNFPNPFNPSTLISFDIKENKTGKLSIYNIKGQLLVKGEFEAGTHNYPWNANDQSSGVYFYKLQVDRKSMIKKMVLVK